MSILAVIAVHSGLVTGPAASAGVTVFFALSGFLITTLLIEEYEGRGTISLRLFYARRALRLLPALAVMLIAVTTFTAFDSPGRDAKLVFVDSLCGLFYVANWARVLGFFQASALAHTWSLSIEEQFYMAWPIALLLILRKTTNRKSLVCWILLAIVLMGFYRGVLMAAGASYYHLQRGTDTRADSLLFGVAGAVLFTSGIVTGNSPRPRVSSSLAWLALAIVIVFTVLDVNVDSISHYMIDPVIAFCATAIILEVVTHPATGMARMLQFRPLVYVGQISYGLYLWHYPIFRILSTKDLSRGQRLAIGMILTLAGTLLSYYLIERPLAFIRTRFAAANQSGLPRILPFWRRKTRLMEGGISSAR